MKKILPILFIVYSVIAIGQDNKKSVFGINSGVIYSAITAETKAFLGINIDRGIHTFGFGPVVGPNWEYPWSNQIISNYIFNGLLLNYQVHPIKSTQIFDFFFEYNLLIGFDRTKDPYVYFDYPTLSYKEDNCKGLRLNYENYIGYGFRLNFLKNFYLNTSVGAGFIFQSTRMNFESLQVSQIEVLRHR